MQLVQYQLTSIDCCWLCHKFLCSTSSKGTQPFDFTNRNLIRILAYKVKYIRQINGSLIILSQIKEHVF